MECCFGFVASSDGTFVDDGSQSVQARGGQFEVKGKPPGDSPVNARFTKALASGMYFEVKCLDMRGSAFVGVSTEAGFQRGYKQRGLFYGGPGNLSDGNSLAKGGFGTRVERGDVIGILYETCHILSPVQEETVTLTVYHNKRCLGPAFVSKMATAGSQVYPVVTAGDNGDKFCLRFTTPPPQRLREPKKYKSGYEGSWALTKVASGPELSEFPLNMKTGGQLVTMVVEDVQHSPQDAQAQHGAYRLGLKVANNMNFQATSTPTASLKPFDACRVGPGMSTRMRGTAGQMEVEGNLSNAWMPAVQQWLARPDSLLMKGPTVELSFSRHAEVVTPVESVILP